MGVTVTGIGLRQFKGEDEKYHDGALVSLDVVPVAADHEGQAPTIEELAQFVKLNPDDVLSAILDLVPNTGVVRAIYQDSTVVPDPVYGQHGPRTAKLTDLSSASQMKRARIQLKRLSLSYKPIEEYSIVQIYTTKHEYLDWHVPKQGTDKKPLAVLVPLSDKFRDFLRPAAEARASETNVALTKEDLTSLDERLDLLKTDVEQLTKMLKEAVDYERKGALKYCMLEPLDGLLGAVMKWPSNQIDVSKLKALRDSLDNLHVRATKSFFVPASSKRSAIDWKAGLMVDNLEDAGFEALITRLVSQKDLVKTPIWQKAHDVLYAAVSVLADVPSSQHRLGRDHVIPLLQLVNEKIQVPESVIPSDLDEDYKKALRDTSPAPPKVKPSVIDALALGAFKGFLGTFGNMPGPSTFAVATLQRFSPWILAMLDQHTAMPKLIPTLVIQEGAITSRSKVFAWFLGRMTKYLAGSAGLDTVSFQTVVKQIGKKENGLPYVFCPGQEKGIEVKKLSVTARFQSSTGWSAFCAVFNLLVIIETWRDETSDHTFHKVVDSVAAAGSALGALVQRATTIAETTTQLGAISRRLASLDKLEIKSLSRLAQRAKPLANVKITALNGIMGAAAVLGIASGVLSTVESAEQGDGLGAVINGVGTVGSVLTTVGWLMSLGAASSATGLGVVPGSGLMLAGTVIGIGAMAASEIKSFADALKPGPREVFDVFIAAFENQADVKEELKVDSDLKAALDAVKQGSKDADWSEVQAFPDVAALKQLDDKFDPGEGMVCPLWDLGFTSGMIGRIVGSSADQHKIDKTLLDHKRSDFDPDDPKNIPEL